MHRLSALAVIPVMLAFVPVALAQGAYCMEGKERDRIRMLTYDAIDQAYREQIMNLFSSWMRDATDQPRRAQVGVQNAIRAHIAARNLSMRWLPPVCGEPK